MTQSKTAEEGLHFENPRLEEMRKNIPQEIKDGVNAHFDRLDFIYHKVKEHCSTRESANKCASWIDEYAESFARQEKIKLLEELMKEIKPIWHNQPPGAARQIVRSKLNQLNE